MGFRRTLMRILQLTLSSAFAICGMVSVTSAQNAGSVANANPFRLLITAPRPLAMVAPPAPGIHVSRPYTGRIIVPAVQDEKFIHPTPANYTFAMPIIGPERSAELIPYR